MWLAFGSLGQEAEVIREALIPAHPTRSVRKGMKSLLNCNNIEWQDWQQTPLCFACLRKYGINVKNAIRVL